jgi:hypothetical protein
MTAVRSPATVAEGLGIPKAVLERAEQVLELTDSRCRDHLDEEYADLSLYLVAKLAHKRPSPLARGDVTLWAAGAIYTVGRINFLFDREQSKPHLSRDGLAEITGVAKSAMANKARQICHALDIGDLEFEYCRIDLLCNHPFGWYVQLDTGVIVDSRSLPKPVFAEAVRRGVIPAVAELVRRGYFQR